jgi:hypothetical protein
MNLPTLLREIQGNWLVYRPTAKPCRRVATPFAALAARRVLGGQPGTAMAVAELFVDGDAVQGDDATRAR